MVFYDATLPMRNGMVTFPGDPPFQITPVHQRSKGDAFELSLLSMGTHAGTHIDSPKHFLEHGIAVDQVSLKSLIGPGIVLDLRGRARIDRDALEGSPIGDHRRVLFRTDSGRFLAEGVFREDHVYLDESGARFLIEKGILLVGIDFLSIEAHAAQDGPVHRMLLGAGIVILEGACLHEVPPGPYEILCLPLRIENADGGPARVVLRKDGQ